MSAKRPYRYPEVDSQPSFPAVEGQILDFWRREGIFQASIDRRPAGEHGSNEYVFYDGPPFANGLPHYGHLLTGYVKDVIPRYQTLRGRRVERRFGWDCHGLPAEMEAENELDIRGRAAIEEYGIALFNEHCRNSVMQYTEAWVETVTRQARWVDFRNDYKTLDLPYMESVIWAFKQLWDKGLIYEGHKVLAYSWAAQTPISNFETRLDDSYRPRQDPAVTVRVSLEPDGDSGPAELWIWTTTPWTLPSNLAVAVGPDVDYAVLEKDGRRIMLGAATTSKYTSELEGAREVGTIKGRDLEGRRYQPLFPFFADHPNSFRVLLGDFVDTDEGTGVVHMAPGFGEDDMAVCAANNIEVVCPVDEAGAFTTDVPPYAGQNVLETNTPIIRDLRARELLVRHDTYEHNYPHCWRTGTPLIYKAVSSWFVRVSDLRERMVELNQQINWMPAHIRNGLFGNWLEGARDWPISRSRFWGSPLPVWRSDNPQYPRTDVYGSLDEIETDFGVRPNDLHRPAIDELVRPNPDDPSGQSNMVRVPEVLDCWFESGSMPYAQVHYPFENVEWFDANFPADFITEYVAQTRGWFYTLMVLSTALFDRPPFRNCICHGVVLDEDGQKLSKRLRNYPSPEEVFDTYGSDALRWFLVASPILRGQDLQIDREGRRIREVVRLVLNPIWNAYAFFCLYANTEAHEARTRTDSADILDRYILAKTRALVLALETHMEAYDLPAACAEFTAYSDVLNNWYIRRSRDRFYKHGQELEPEAYDTLFTVLTTAMQTISPLLPMIAESIYKGLTGEKSVHLTDWPDVASWPREDELVSQMDRVREACTAALALRRAHDVRVRQPLRKLLIAGPNAEALRPFVNLIQQEVNVKEVGFETEVESYAGFRLQVNSRLLGKRLGKKMQQVIKAAKAGDWESRDDGVEVAGELLRGDDYSIKLDPREGVVCQALASNDAIAILDLEIDDALEREGRARDIVRVVQQARREAELHVSDRIHVVLELENEWRDAASTFHDYIAGQTLAQTLDLDSPVSREGYFLHEATLGREPVRIALAKVA